MKLNAHILHDYLSIPLTDAVLHTSRLERSLDGISFYSPPKRPPAECVCIVEAKQLPDALRSVRGGTFLCRGHSAIPVLDGCSVLFVDERFELTEIFDSLQDVFRQFSNWECQLLTLVADDIPFQAMADSALTFFYNPIAMYTATNRNIFFSERKKETKYRLFNPEDQDAYLSDQEVEELKFREDFIQSLSTTEPSIFPPEMWGYQILYINIRISGLYVARLMVCETDRPLQDSDYPLLDFLAGFFRRAMQKLNSGMTNHPRDFDSCIRRLLKRKIPDTDLLSRILARYNWSIHDYYFCVVIKESTYNKTIQTVFALCSKLEARFPGSASFQLKNDILLIVNLRQDETRREQMLSILAYVLRESILKAGVSNTFRDLTQLSDYDEQARAALEIGSVCDETIWCYHYENYALRYMLQRAAFSTTLSALCPPGLQALLQYDLQHKRTFTYSLKVYLENDRSIAKSIGVLYLQRSTFLYQLQRIQKITQLDLDNYTTRLQLQMVFELLEENGICLNPVSDLNMQRPGH